MDDFITIIIKRLIRDPITLILPILLVAAIALFMLVLKTPQDLPKDRLLFYTIIPVIAAMMVFLLRYLSPYQRYDDESAASEMWRLREKFEAALETRRSISKTEQEKLVAALANKIKEQTAEEVIADIRKRIGKADFSRLIEENAQSMLRRIYREIDALGRRGNLNLVLGFVMATSGVGLLAYIVLRSTDQHTNIQPFLMAFLPRLSIVAIIELFSYFFLRLYKASLADIKYFQNEATNVESALLALRVALNLESASEIKQAINALLTVDRNLPLSTGVTTREIEDAKLFKDPATVSVQSLIEIIKALPQKKD